MKRWSPWQGIALLALVLLGWGLAQPAQAQEPQAGASEGQSPSLPSDLAALPASERVIRLSSLEWPPYSGALLPNQGASIEVVRLALQEIGWQLDVEFFPWLRAVASARNGRHHGYFPEYWFETDDFLLSPVIGTGPLGLVEAKNKPIEWDVLTDLTQYRIGIVSGYVNTTDMDAMIERGALRVYPAPDDVSNMRKVAAGRIDAAVIDPFVMRYLAQTALSLRDVKGIFQMNPTYLGQKTLHVAWTLDNAHFNEVLRQALERIDVQRIQTEYFKRYGYQ